jgi:hypothetical protein
MRHPFSLERDMTRSLLSPSPASRRNVLASCVIASVALSAPIAATAATTWTVDSCNGDDTVSGSLVAHTGSLRFTINAAASGDTIDVSQIGCPQSKISLTTGEIFVTQPSLTILGPGVSGLTIDGSGLPGGATGPNNSRPFTHTGTGTLTLDSLRVSGGHVYHYGNGYASRGGCVYSKGSVELIDAEISDCSADSESDLARGGGVYAMGHIGIKYSSISGNTAFGSSSSQGGGAFSVNGFGAKYSSVSGNSALGHNGSPGTASAYKYTVGGGVYTQGSIKLKRSTISNNYSYGSFAGIAGVGSVGTASNNYTKLYSSTISGNRANKFNGGVYTNAGTVGLYNSTIAFNTAGIGHAGSSPIYFIGPGLALSGALTAMNVTLQSSLLSNNTYGSSSEFDLTTGNSTSQDTFHHTITFNGDSANPANNLVRTRLVQDSMHELPPDTQFFVCPLLGPLRDNGGLTLTHALLSTSPAIDVGNNILNYTEDQRESGADMMPYPYPRVSNGQADIGAYEVNQDDIIFNSEFEGCPILF